MPDPYDMLGVRPGASPDEIERAYRRRIVEVHRRGVFGIVGRLRGLQRARSALEDRAERRRWEELRDQAVRSAGRNEAERRRREEQVLSAYRKQRARESSRLGLDALHDNVELMVDVEQRIVLAEQADARLRLYRRLKVAVVRGALLLIAMLAAWLSWQHWLGGF
jgi:hypothetical protein